MLKYDYHMHLMDYVNALYFAVVVLEGFHDRHERRIKMFSEFGPAEEFARKRLNALHFSGKLSERIAISAVKDDGSYHYIEMEQWEAFRLLCASIMPPNWHEQIK